ncbi:MAG: hypothetical protein P1R58_02020 [bacterium]|nr:hypothetical protein [bacterium]
MNSVELISQAKAIAETASGKAEEYSGLLGTARSFIIQNFGENGLIAAYIALAAFLLFIISRLAKITFSTIKYLVLPAVALAFVASFFVPYTFFALLPVTVTFSSLFLLFRG